MKFKIKNNFKTSWNILFWLVFILSINHGFCQQIQWAKLYTIPAADQINCIAQDQDGFIYAGGNSRKEMFFPGGNPKAVLYKLFPDGDTIFSLWTGIYGQVSAIIPDSWGNIKLAVFKEGLFPNGATQLHLLSMTPEGLIFKRDTIPNILYVTNSCIGKDSSWILCGYRQNDFNSNWEDFYVQRIRKDGTIEPFQSLNPNHPSCRASRVEQLPNGKYLVSGFVGSRIASYTLNEDLSNPQFSVWYQTPNLSNLFSGAIVQSVNKKFVFGAQGSPIVTGLFDSLRTRIWMKKDTGVAIMPQAMTDGSLLLGVTQRPNPPLYKFERLGNDSSIVWYLNLKDSLLARGYYGALILSAYTFFGDESAVVTGTLYQNGTTAKDPIFIKIANVGTPVTSLSKPKKGPLSNQTLAPWPNPTGGTLYLKQHFDKAEIHFYSISGKTMGSYKINFAQSIDISAFPQGVYLYRAVIDGKGYSGMVVRE